MARSEEPADASRRMRRRHRSYSELDVRGKETTVLEPDLSKVRRVRVERLEGSTSTSRPTRVSKLASESHARLRSIASHRRKEPKRGTVSTKYRSRRKSTTKDESTTTYVYGKPAERVQASRVAISEIRKLGRGGESSESEEQDSDIRSSKSAVEKPKKRKIKVIYVDEDDIRASKSGDRRRMTGKELLENLRGTHDSARRSRAHISRRTSVVGGRPASPPKRNVSTRDPPTEARPGLRRSNTATSHTPSAKPAYDPSMTSTSASKRSSFLGSFFGPAVQQHQHQEPERLVECLTCLSDDIPISKSAKLKCGHRMCHPCLKRIFKLSVTDPQHMPPKCCTADHIPLKHVERLFDNKFKKNWNMKFAEYSTKNRIYCPGRRCGEWIKPGNIHKEDGKKVGKCSRCKTKVCCLCNGKWHGSKDCPKDEETNRLLEAAKQAGWQRCYNCRTMVELKEGCNHMTCRCMAEFCMICGLKWKSCNCPWFNYDQVEADRLEHMQIPMPAGLPGPPLPPAPLRLRRPRPPRPPDNYHEEITQRRRQERADEELARRLHGVNMDDGGDDYQGGIGDIHGIGNAAGHFMNQDYVRAAHNILTGNYNEANAAADYVMGVAQARGAPPPPGPRGMADRYPAPQAVRPPSPPLMRRHTMREQADNPASNTRLEERVVPRRVRRDYESEAAVHAPAGPVPQRTASTREPSAPRPSVLAGLGTRRGENRVDAWRTHVEPGVEPAEGMLSM